MNFKIVSSGYYIVASTYAVYIALNHKATPYAPASILPTDVTVST